MNKPVLDRLGEWLSAPGVFPEARHAIEALDPLARADMDRRLELLTLTAGQTVFDSGAPRDAAYMIVTGHIGVAAEGCPVRVFGPGEGVGEIGLVSRGPHTTTARALDEVRAYKLGKLAFEALCERYPQDMSRLADFITPVAHETLLARVICDLLGERDAAQLDALLAEIETQELKRGEFLVRAGEEADRMFVVIYGRLRIVVLEEDGTERVIDEIGRGDTVGEKSLLSGEVRSATVFALRDSAVGVITRPVFESLLLQYPEVMARLVRIALRRVQRQSALHNGDRITSAVSFAVLPAGVSPGGLPLEEFSARLAAALSSYGPTLHLSRARLESILEMPGLALIGAGHPSEAMLSAYLQRQEASYRFVIYQADDTWSPWTERCLRLADRVLLLGQGACAPQPTQLDEHLASHSDSTTTELILLQPDHRTRPSGTAAWLARYPAVAHHHIHLGHAPSFDSFVRRITGHGLGLVLGGGGARGFAHIGVFRALAEAGVPVDFVGGTSMGAILSATFAMGLDTQATLQLAHELASPLKLFDPTMPVVSFFASGKITRVLERIYGDLQMEDLWLPCFCVSSNLTHAVAMVHRLGPLWQAVRASMAIPGVFSPILADGDLLVDGCVLNNLPIDVMQRLNHDGPIIAVNVFPDVDLLRDYRFGPSISGWQALVNKLNPLHPDSDAPLIFESLLRVLALNDVHQAKTKRGFADVYIRPTVEQFNILDFGAYAQIAEIGYDSARQALDEWQALRERTGAPAACLPRTRLTAPLHTALDELEGLLTGLGDIE